MLVCLPATGCVMILGSGGHPISSPLCFSIKLLPNFMPNWPGASLPDFFSGKFQSNSKCASSECLVILLLNGSLAIQES